MKLYFRYSIDKHDRNTDPGLNTVAEIVNSLSANSLTARVIQLPIFQNKMALAHRISRSNFTTLQPCIFHRPVSPIVENRLLIVSSASTQFTVSRFPVKQHSHNVACPHTIRYYFLLYKYTTSQ